MSDSAPRDVALKPWLARQAYSLLLRLGTPAYLWRVWARGREEPAYRADWPWRLGWYGRAYREAVACLEGQPVLWLVGKALSTALGSATLLKISSRRAAV